MNKFGKNIVLMLSDNNFFQGFFVKKGFMMFFIKFIIGNLFIMFKVVDLMLNQLMKINGKDDIVLILSLIKGVFIICEIFVLGML